MDISYPMSQYPIGTSFTPIFEKAYISTAECRLRSAEKKAKTCRAVAVIYSPIVKGTSAELYIQGCQMAKFDPFLSLDCAKVEGVGGQSKEMKGSNFAA